MGLIEDLYEDHHIFFEYCIKRIYEPKVKQNPLLYYLEEPTKYPGWLAPNVLNLYIGPKPTVTDNVQAADLGGGRGIVTANYGIGDDFEDDFELAIKHEMGHMLNLPHTFSKTNESLSRTKECVGTNSPGTGLDNNLNPAGDGIADTPPDPRAFHGPNRTLSWPPTKSTGCSLDHVTELRVDYFGIPIKTSCMQEFSDPTNILSHNPMSYYGCDEQQYFTEGQGFAMRCFGYINSHFLTNGSHASATAIDASDIDNYFDPTSSVSKLKDQDLIIDGIVNIDEHFVIEDCNLFFTSGSGIVVSSNGSLFIRGSNLDHDFAGSCGSPTGTWNGIQFGGNQFSINETDANPRSRISNAVVNITSGSIEMINADFSNNDVNISDAATGNWEGYTGVPHIRTENCNFIKSELISDAGPHLIYNCYFKHYDSSSSNTTAISGSNLNVISNKVEDYKIALEAGNNVYVESNELGAHDFSIKSNTTDIVVIKNNKLYSPVDLSDVQMFIVSQNEINTEKSRGPFPSPLSLATSFANQNDVFVRSNLIQGFGDHNGAYGLWTHGSGDFSQGLIIECNQFEEIRVADLQLEVEVKSPQGRDDRPAANIFSNIAVNNRISYPTGIAVDPLEYFFFDDGDNPDPNNVHINVFERPVTSTTVFPDCKVGTDWEELDEEPLAFGWFWGCGVLYWQDRECLLSLADSCCTKATYPEEQAGSIFEEWNDNDNWIDVNNFNSCYSLQGGSDIESIKQNQKLTLEQEAQLPYNNKGTGDVEITIYPNPSEGEFVLILSNFNNESLYHMEIYTMDGKSIKKTIIEKAKSNISDLQVGLYLIKLFENSELIKQEKIIVIEN